MTCFVQDCKGKGTRWICYEVAPGVPIVFDVCDAHWARIELAA